MISAKRAAFRQQIRRRQIDQKFRQRRREIMIERQLETVIQQNKQFVKQLSNIMSDLRQSRLSKNYFQMHENLHSLKKFVINSKLSLRNTITRQDFHLIEEISQVLDVFSKSELEVRNKMPIFQYSLLIIVELISYQSVDTNRIINSSFIETLIPYLQLEISKQLTFINIFRILGNMVAKSQQIANIYNRFNIPQITIKMLLALDPKRDSKYLPQFLFFLCSYFQITKTVAILTSEQVNACLVTSRQAFNYYLCQNISENKVQCILQDCLKIIKQILNFELIEGSNPNINISTIIDLIHIKNFPINIKKQALFIIDSIVYLDNSDYAVQMVFKHKLIQKMFGIQNEIEYIALNILSNLAFYPDLKPILIPNLQRIKLSLNYEPRRKQLYYFILNYFSSQKFKIEVPQQQYLIKQLWNSPDCGLEIITLQARIWLGLVSYGYQDRPPLKILRAHQLQDVQSILYLLQHQTNQEQ